jgi:hypothetical protein
VIADKARDLGWDGATLLYLSVDGTGTLAITMVTNLMSTVSSK